MDVAVSEDGLYAFGGVQRGSVELAAVYLGDVEKYLDERFEEEEENDDLHAGRDERETPGLLDLLQVDRHADAKLKGFGACARLWNGWERAVKSGERPEYLLFTGKGIKNIHIWSYKPSRLEKNEESVWTCLYDTPGNGTSINQLYFRHNLHGTLQGISKSDDQKLRVWDLSYEQKRIANSNGTGESDGKDRPKRPDYVDMASTEGTVGVCGPYAFASGSLGGMHDLINVVGLDADDASSPYNCTQLALPSADGSGDLPVSGRPSRTGRTGRQQRGDLKSVVHVAGLVFDASHALLQLSDGSVVHYLHDDRNGHPLLLQSPPSLCATCVDDDISIGMPQQPQNKRMALARVGSQGMVLFAVSSFNENSSRGAIMLRALPGSANDNVKSVGRLRKYWGFNGLRRKRNKQMPLLKESSRSSSPTFDGVVLVKGTPLVAAKISKKPNAISPSELPVSATKKTKKVESPTEPVKSSHLDKKRSQKEGFGLEPILESTPVAQKSTATSVSKKRPSEESSGQKQTNSRVESTLMMKNDTDKADKLIRISKKRPSEERAVQKQTKSRVQCTPVAAMKNATEKADTSSRVSKKISPEESCGQKQSKSRVECTPVVVRKNTTEKVDTLSRISKKISPKEGVGQKKTNNRVECTPVAEMKNAPEKADISSRISKKKRPAEEGLRTEQRSIQVECTPVSAKIKIKVKKRPLEDGSGIKPKVNSQLECTPVPDIKGQKKTPKPLEPTVKASKPINLSNRQPTEQGQRLEQKDWKVDSEKGGNAPSLLEPAASTIKPSHPSKSPSTESLMLEQTDSTPVPSTKGNNSTSAREVTPGVFSPAPLKPTTETDKGRCPSKKRSSEIGLEPEPMDSQLESIVQESVHSPKRSITDVEELDSTDVRVATKKQKTTQENLDVIAEKKAHSAQKPPPSSPKKRGRKRIQSPKTSPKATTESSPAKEAVPEPEAAPEFNNRKVGFLGMTIVENKFEKKFSESCHQPREHPPLLCEQLPDSTIDSRLLANASTLPPNFFATEITTKAKSLENVHFKRHCEERRALAAKHRAEHEMIRKKVLHSIRYTLSSWDMELDSTRSHSAIADSAKSWFDDALLGHQEMLNDMLDRQMLEAESLAARHTADLPNESAPTLQVSFPFPEVFEQARQELMSMLK